jgi:hypothetical protein
MVSKWTENGNIVEYAKANPHADRFALVKFLSSVLTPPLIIA